MVISDLDAVLAEARKRGAKALDEPSGKRILASFGIDVPRSRVVRLDDEIGVAVSAMSPPFALKVVAAGVVHKSDVGGVRLGLCTAEEIEGVIAGLRASLLEKGIEPAGWLIEEMVAGGVEVVVGGILDPEFGPMVMVGLGGVFVEVLKDVAFRICPITALDAVEMVEELRGGPLLRGARGHRPVSIDALVDVMLRLGGEVGLLLACGDRVAEIDINPMIVTPDRACAVDARFILREPA
ncbi:MAG: acetate--CoA ligase family protein [Caldimonas sp.]